jgi:hypothetical protein
MIEETAGAVKTSQKETTMLELGWYPAPTQTWLCCRQCRRFYTRARPCPCRQEETENAAPLTVRHVGLQRALARLLGGLKTIVARRGGMRG